MSEPARMLSDGDVAALRDELAARPLPALLTADEAAVLLSVPASWILAEARAKRIPHVKLGRYVRFDPDDLAAWRQARKEGPVRLAEARRAA